MRKLRRRNVLGRIDENIVNAVALLADKVLVVLYEGIEVLRASQCQHLQLPVANKLLQVSIDRSETDVRKVFANLRVDLVCGGMGGVVFYGFPNNLQLLRVSSTSVHVWKCYATRSSINDFLVSDGMRTLAL
jgi:hypothetical protein